MIGVYLLIATGCVLLSPMALMFIISFVHLIEDIVKDGIDDCGTAQLAFMCILGCGCLFGSLILYDRVHTP